MTAKRVIQASAIDTAAKNGDIEIGFFLKSFPLLLTCHALTLSSGVMLPAGNPKNVASFLADFPAKTPVYAQKRIGWRSAKARASLICR